LRVMRTAESFSRRAYPVESAGLFYPMRRILFVKTSSLGDVVHHLPAVSDAARRFPEAAIDWVVEEAFADVASMHRAVRRVIPVATRRWRRAPWRPAVWSEAARFRAELRAEAYDAVIDTQSLLKSALITSAARGTKHGLDRASAREPLAARFYDVVHRVPKGLHAVERNRRLTALSLGFEPGPALDYGVKQASVDASPYAVFLTMTSRDDKLWPEARWIELGRALGMPVRLPWGSETERARAERVAAGIGAAQVLPRMGIAALGAQLAGAKRVVGLDTGLTHLAAALGVRTLGIYCGSEPMLTGLHAPGARSLGRAGAPPTAAEVCEALA
jgi:heptosyltransferase-1